LIWLMVRAATHCSICVRQWRRAVALKPLGGGSGSVSAARPCNNVPAPGDGSKLPRNFFASSLSRGRAISHSTKKSSAIMRRKTSDWHAVYFDLN
jgi:hypothetical protein